MDEEQKTGVRQQMAAEGDGKGNVMVTCCAEAEFGRAHLKTGKYNEDGSGTAAKVGAQWQDSQ